MTTTDWVRRHPHLEPLAGLERRVQAAIESNRIRLSRAVAWDRYHDDFEAGVPLLKSGAAAVDLRRLDAVVDRVIRDLSIAPDAGLQKWIAAMTVARHLRPLVRIFEGWRDDDGWLRNICPMCGSPPAMAQLVGKDPRRRRRVLHCGLCRSRWRYGRTSCPFCQTGSHRLTVLHVDDDAGLRLDYCDVCRGYLKTYDGEGDEAVLLADWTSLHLDIAALARGLRRRAASLYDAGAGGALRTPNVRSPSETSEDAGPRSGGLAAEARHGTCCAQPSGRIR